MGEVEGVVFKLQFFSQLLDHFVSLVDLFLHLLEHLFVVDQLELQLLDVFVARVVGPQLQLQGFVLLLPLFQSLLQGLDPVLQRRGLVGFVGVPELLVLEPGLKQDDLVFEFGNGFGPLFGVGEFPHGLVERFFLQLALFFFGLQFFLELVVGVSELAHLLGDFFELLLPVLASHQLILLFFPHCFSFLAGPF